MSQSPAANRKGRRDSPSISWMRKFRLKRAVKGAPIGRRETGVSRRPMGAPPPAVETLDSPFQSEKGLFQEIDGELRRLRRAGGGDRALIWLLLAIAKEKSQGWRLNALSP